MLAPILMSRERLRNNRIAAKIIHHFIWPRVKKSFLVGAFLVGARKGRFILLGNNDEFFWRMHALI